MTRIQIEFPENKLADLIDFLVADEHTPEELREEALRWELEAFGVEEPAFA